ncbi:class I SAM-dependent methyltransferase [bacterium]|nr:class I SAM-dependent methyltransferase [bacterium]
MGDPPWSRQAHEDWQAAIEAARRLQQIYNNWLSKIDQLHSIPTIDQSVPLLQKIQQEMNEMYALPDQQQVFNARAVHLINELLDYLRSTTTQLSKLLALQIEYFQQITPWMDAKIQELRLEENHNVTYHVGDIAKKLDELQMQIASLEGQVRKSAAGVPSAPAAGTPASSPREKDFRYHVFEQVFREPYDRLKESLRRYLPYFENAPEPILDLGCGRGEFLQLMKESGKNAYGVDISEYEVERLRSAGLNATAEDIFEHVQKLELESTGAVFCAQVVEHLPPETVHNLLSCLHRVMKKGAPLVMETVNPLSVFGFHHLFFKDPTHVFPVHPETLLFMLRYAGFKDVEAHLISPVPEQQKLPEPKKEDFHPAVYEYLKSLTGRLNRFLYESLEYYVIGYRK